MDKVGATKVDDSMVYGQAMNPMDCDGLGQLKRKLPSLNHVCAIRGAKRSSDYGDGCMFTSPCTKGRGWILAQV